MNKIIIEYQPELREQLDAARLYQRNTRKHQVYRVMSLLCLGAAIWMLFTNGPFMLVGIWSLLAVFLWFDPVPILMIRMSYGGKALKQRYHVEFDREGITFTIGGQTVQRPWSRYRRVLQNQQVYVLVYGTWMYSVIPTRAFASDDERAQFQALLSEATGAGSTARASYPS